MNKIIETIVDQELDIPFKEFTAGQIIQSKQFNDNMNDIEDKVNEIISKYNIIVGSYKEHIINYENPHQVTARQTGAYTIEEVDTYVDDLREGNFNDNSIVNRVLANDCVEARNVKDGSITTTKVDDVFGSQLDISGNIDIMNRYTKNETDEIIKSKVGDGTYTKEEIDNKLGQVQAGQIVDKSISFEQLKEDVGNYLDLTNNASILNMYTKEEVMNLISQNGLPRDWGSITDSDSTQELSSIGALPVANVMLCDSFRASLTDVLNISVAEVVEARNSYASLSERLNLIESNLDLIIKMFNEVNAYE